MSDTLLSNADHGAANRERVRKSLARRHRSETMFRWAGILSIAAALGFVAILFGMIISKGLPSFWQSTVHVEVYFDPELIEGGPQPQRQDSASDADHRAAMVQWQRDVTLSNWNAIVDTALRTSAPDFEIETRDLLELVTSAARFQLRDRYFADPDVLGQTVPVTILASANTDNWLKGTIDRSQPDSRQQLSASTRQLADELLAEGVISFDFAWHIFTNVDSRSAPASAGLAGAFMGSLYMMLIVIVLAVPIGVASAVYLEEFAPKNRWTDLIEVNINNLAAVPSIVFGLLGAAVFINYLGLPRSAPLVGGLVLTLMTLPTIIIATRSSLRAVPPSLRQAALGLGASRNQTVFHHVLPLTFPGILTATIIGVAQALGETAPLLLIGMSAFIANIPANPLDSATALPVQIYLWQGNENRNFFEARTSAAIMVLLGMMILLNAIAIFLRTRLERRK
ncbi:phosphate ABC transporter permease PstA [Pelagibacterium halotolerans]|uniref:phosphate ABC transporter permease PstA n=1 Tax=Pelagibacterium halotolerans TaxID=531813 RepID=UPI00068214F1|nr:phosphate ABC transporter permease PstA [Pelagibacterium halotolerans]QJR19670.1 phosphate ABC transporter permease PstA [Pelagibacterium halotolerans]SEA98421.1 phosphate ABC transporter membrane protein 2, PhoT family [Pelagibacterium halotolerans]